MLAAPAPASPGQKFWLGLGIALMTALGSLPVLFLLWAVGTLVGVVFVAEALERTRGLAPATYGGAFWLAVAFVGLLVLLEIATWFAPRKDGERPTGCMAALFTRPMVAVLVLLLPCVLLVRCDLGGTDVPDIMTTTALLCVLGYGLFALPIAFVALALRVARWLWRVGQRSSFRSGVVAGAGILAGAILPTCVVCAPVDPDEAADNERYSAALDRGLEALADQIDRKGLVEGSMAALTVAATVIPGTSGPWTAPPVVVPPATPESPPEARLRSCVALFTGRPQRTATVEAATRWLMDNRAADRDTANLVAYDTVLKVCSRHVGRPIADLVPYFWAAVKKNFCKNLGRNPLARCSTLDAIEATCELGGSYGSPGQIDAAIDLRARFCRLEDRDHDIVLRSLEGETSEEIAAALAMTAANVRQRNGRALKKMADMN